MSQEPSPLTQSKTVDGITTNHIWDGTNMVAETDGTDVINTYYRGANGLMYATLEGKYRAYLKDGHGNITGLTDITASSLRKSYTYDAFGTEINKDESDTNPFRYCGEYYDNELDKIYLRARYYSPIQGRFMTEDPIKDGMNWYGYCGGDPVNFVDPSGLITDAVVENGVVVDYRLPLRDIVRTLGGTIKVNDDSVTVDALGKNINIMYSEYADDVHNVGGRLHFTPGEVLDLLGVEYDMERVSVTITKKDNNKAVANYAAVSVINGKLMGSFQGIIEDGIEECLGAVQSAVVSAGIGLGLDIKDAVNEAKGTGPKVLPVGEYGKIEYRIKTPKTGEKNAVVSLTYGRVNDYVMFETEHWCAEFNSTKVGNGYQVPEYINVNSHR